VGHLRCIGHPKFSAIDFETADRRKRTACAVALARVEDNQVVAVESWFIHPPDSSFEFSNLHGIDAAAVAGAPTFQQLWSEFRRCLSDALFLAAHNASFDRAVLRCCCEDARVSMPKTPFVCSANLARQAWSLDGCRLPDVCKHLGLPLSHHDPRSDAEACARIVLAARPVVLEDTRSGRRYLRFEVLDDTCRMITLGYRRG